MAGRKPIAINMKSTSPEGEVKFFKTIHEAARELGFSERGVGKAYHEKRSRIGGYELQWLEPEPEPSTDSKPIPKPETTTNCWICNQPLDPKDRMNSRCLELEELDGNGNVIDSFFPEALYRASKISGLSLNTLRNARDKGNRLLVRRSDKKQFRITWCTSHDTCFKARREREREEERNKDLEEWQERLKRRPSFQKLLEEERKEME